MTAAGFRKLCLALPGVTEHPHFTDVVFKVKKKIFVALGKGGKQAQVRVTPRERLEAMLEQQPDVFAHLGKYTDKDDAIGVNLAKVDPGLLEELVRESYEFVAGPPATKKPARR